MRGAEKKAEEEDYALVQGAKSGKISADDDRPTEGALSALAKCPRELWLVCVIKALMSFAYFALFNVLTLYLTEDFGMSDAVAGWVYGVHGVIAGMLSLLGGVATDLVGNERSLMVGSVLLAVGYAMLAWTTSTSVALFALLVFKTCGSALTMPALMVAVTHYSPKESRAYAYSLFYVIMNFSAGLAVLAITVSRHALANLPNMRGTTKWRVIAGLSFATSIMQVALASTLRRPVAAAVPTRERSRRSIVGTTCEALREPRLWRFTILIFIFVGVRSVFRHLDATFPKYYVRSFGDSSGFEMILMVNPTCILLLTPLMTCLVQHLRLGYSTVFLLGASISGASPLALAVNSSHLACLCFVLFLSLGESIWSPKLYEYSVAVAPRGKEATYSALSTMPAFLATGFIGGLSGHLVEEYCPAQHECQGRFLWLMVGLTTITSPALLLFLRPFLFSERDLAEELIPPTSRSAGARYSDQP